MLVLRLSQDITAKNLEVDSCKRTLRVIDEDTCEFSVHLPRVRFGDESKSELHLSLTMKMF